MQERIASRSGPTDCECSTGRISGPLAELWQIMSCLNLRLCIIAWSSGDELCGGARSSCTRPRSCGCSPEDDGPGGADAGMRPEHVYHVKEIRSLCNMQGTYGFPLMTAQSMQLSPRRENAGLGGDQSKKGARFTFFSFLSLGQTIIREYETNAVVLQASVAYRLRDVASNSSEMDPTASDGSSLRCFFQRGNCLVLTRSCKHHPDDPPDGSGWPCQNSSQTSTTLPPRHEKPKATTERRAHFMGAVGRRHGGWESGTALITLQGRF